MTRSKDLGYGQPVGHIRTCIIHKDTRFCNCGWGNKEPQEAQLPRDVLEAVIERGETAALMTAEELFEAYCDYNGLINWSRKLTTTLDAIRRARP